MRGELTCGIVSVIGWDQVTVVGTIQHCAGACQGGLECRVEGQLNQVLVIVRRESLAVVNDVDVPSWYVLWCAAGTSWDGSYVCGIAEVGVL